MTTRPQAKGKKKAPRKPRLLRFGSWLELEAERNREFYLTANSGISVGYDARDARRLAAWLLKFADWADYQGKKKC